MSFLGRLLVKNVYDGSGNLMPPEPAIQVIGGTVTDNTTLGATVITFAASSVAWASDLVNSTSANQYVSSLSFSSNSAGGAIGINGTGTTLVIAAANTGFSLTQAQSTTGGGADLTFAAQAAKGGSSGTGGRIFIKGGDGDGSGLGGYVQIRSGNSSGTGGQIVLNTQGTTPGVISFQSNAAEYASLSGTLASGCNLTVDAGTTGGLNVTQATSTTGGGADMHFTAQSAFATSAATGGRVFIQAGAGDGAGTGGYVQIRSGNSASGTGGQIILNAQGNTPGLVSYQANGAEYLSVGLVGTTATVSMTPNTATSLILTQAAVSGNGNNTKIVAGSSNAANGNGGTLILAGGDLNGSGKRGPTQICIGASSSLPLIEVAEPTVGQAIVSLCKGSAITTTQMPANSGNGVIYIADASSAPTVGPVSGSVLYSTSGYLSTFALGIAFNAAVSSPVISFFPAAGATMALTMQGQSAGGTNDGGAVVLTGGQKAGASQVDGSVKVTTPLNIGELEFSPVNGAQTLTNAQSDANVINLGGAASGSFTINYLRRISDTSLLFVSNRTSQACTIAYLTGGTASVATGTSAVICSNGTNLVKIMAGT